VLDRFLASAVCDPCWLSIRPIPEMHGGCRGSVDCAQAVGAYEGALRAIIHALKYDGRRSLAGPLGALMREAGAILVSGADFAVPVPLHPWKKRRRGFNQAADLARRLDLRVCDALERVRATAPQADLTAAERRLNVQEAFRLVRAGRALAGAVVVLVDDVYTTGATLEACARVLKQAGAREVRALTAARVASPPR
jgi:ComF family protein